MSKRGTDFLHKWIRNNVPDTTRADIISVAELAQKLFADARALGISSTEIEEDTGSVYETILDAIVQDEAGLAG
ncbi:DUF768 domain-containing protein [Mesorhizobium amorphae]|uniref:DUF768 domain-containing protein n=1 Tax=Mesorhizobium amorphae CCNWGS0123 TaxID=1082933 RepID=G6YFE7_9HYPH|nr:DUF768 domain-containing protein [Mesorhizobium amorphae]ANT52973.1 hypothetical protein A6B35_25405 [Mesorhizobium amorphae CCNWGS0123]EHH09535.1 hypothetical protein MEA186_23481 [Mesorhizobium amorphae CCNWGS0123]GLR40840.1 hypothetical protein GCM10007880_13560 [Mesorhizobium amorphae]